MPSRWRTTRIGRVIAALVDRIREALRRFRALRIAVTGAGVIAVIALVLQVIQTFYPIVHDATHDPSSEPPSSSATSPGTHGSQEPVTLSGGWDAFRTDDYATSSVVDVPPGATESAERGRLPDLTKPGNGTIGWSAIGVTGAGPTVTATAPGTTLILGVRIRDRHCTEPLSGTWYGTPGNQGGGSEEPQVYLGLNVEEPNPITRALTLPSGKLGAPWHDQIALEQGDARVVHVSFFAAHQSCTFRADLVVNSQSHLKYVPIPSHVTDDLDGSPTSYTFGVTAAASTYRRSYELDYRPDASGYVVCPGHNPMGRTLTSASCPSS